RAHGLRMVVTPSSPVPVIPVASVASPEDVASQAPCALADVNGAPAPELATGVRFAATSDAFVAQFEAVAEPPLAARHGDGEDVFRDECVELFLSSPLEPFAYDEFVVNPLGALYMARIVNLDESRETWGVSRREPPDGASVGVWGDPAARPAREWMRWSCRLTVPWRSLSPGRPPAPGEERRGNAYRIARGRSTRFLALSPTLRSSPPDFHVPSRFARLVFGGVSA
ncbi:MAG TPA: carbohydrate-binding family 9-like protein, partial [Thermoanaerobaculia bacterium]|nr:carbohydrate-binding family 9-like protein [Thermoanaerobaculia bacterium]